jgi:hypothetical protein
MKVRNICKTVIVLVKAENRKKQWGENCLTMFTIGSHILGKNE